MKLLLLLLMGFLKMIPALTQDFDPADIKVRLGNTTNDTLRMVLFDSVSFAYSEINSDSSLFYADRSIALAKKLNFPLNEALAMNNKGYALLNMGNYPRSLQTFLSALEIAGDDQNEKKIAPEKYCSAWGMITLDNTPGKYRLQILAWLHFNTGVLYENAKNPEKELFHYSQALRLGEQTANPEILSVTNMNLGRFYLSLKKPDSALIFEKKAYELSRQLGSHEYKGSILLNLGRAYLAVGDTGQAVEYFRKAIIASQKQKYIRGVIAANLLLANINMERNKIDSGYYFAMTALDEAVKLNVPDLMLRSYTAMADFYKRLNKGDSIVKYQRLIINIKDSLFNTKQAQQFQNIDFDERLRQQEIEKAKKDYRERLTRYGLLAGLAIFLLTAIILWRNNWNKQKAYGLLKEQKSETDLQKEKLELTLGELRSTQAQLIQSEKMASLGELTAGVAHEIQNPLNFVNNFSDVNKELLMEMKDELDKGNIDEGKAIANNIIDNEEKINHHGKRADAIVKGMLLHSRSSSGIKEPTDINALADEYLRLAYHGLRAKDKSFNATMKTDFDSSIGKINIIPQDIGRVVLNLINNAFYAVDEKKKHTSAGSVQNVYEPTVSVSTKKINDMVEIKVKDNANGIPQKVLDKIFQPFFTTKPTGQGTGLGLSMSYDIVKAHGGELKVETKEGEGSAFIISLPVH
jgi:two-component system, NtrC family, sensor kinase